MRHLLPEAQTVLICDREDYRAIMNYLYYAASVATCPRLSSLLTRAFFDLRRNYGFRWSLSLRQGTLTLAFTLTLTLTLTPTLIPRHVLTVLLNYGANEKVVFCEDFYNDDKTGIRKHLEEVRKSGQKEAPSSYSLPKLPTFFERRRRMGASGHPVDDASFLLCLTRFPLLSLLSSHPCRFLRLLADFSAGLQAYQEFRHKNNWSDQVGRIPGRQAGRQDYPPPPPPLQVILLYLMLLVGTDRRLVRELAAQEAVTTLLHFHLDSFHSSHWRWGPTKKADSQASKDAGFNHSSVCKTLVRLVNEFFPGEGGREAVAAWAEVPGAPRVTDDSGASDHHLNMLHRLHLLPPSHRGNQVRRYLAYLYLQTLASLPYSLPHTVGLAELAANPQLHYQPAKERQEENKFCEGIKLIVLSKNYDMVMTVVELYDTVVGEVEEGGEQVGEQVEVLRRGVLEWVRRKCPGLQQRGLDEETVRRMQLAEYIDIVDGRWQAIAS